MNPNPKDISSKAMTFDVLLGKSVIRIASRDPHDPAAATPVNILITYARTKNTLVLKIYCKNPKKIAPLA